MKVHRIEVESPYSGGVNQAVREGILRMQAQMEEMPQEDYKLHHYFAPGQYAREIEIPAGNYVVGKIHKHAHINVISKGKVAVLTEDGFRMYEAPLTFVSLPGTKRALYTVEDTVWTTIHCREDGETNPEELEDKIIAKTYEEYDSLACANRANELGMGVEQ